MLVVGPLLVPLLAQAPSARSMSSAQPARPLVTPRFTARFKMSIAEYAAFHGELELENEK
jgi:hypothetical protein